LDRCKSDAFFKGVRSENAYFFKERRYETIHYVILKQLLEAFASKTISGVAK